MATKFINHKGETAAVRFGVTRNETSRNAYWRKSVAEKTVSRATEV